MTQFPIAHSVYPRRFGASRRGDGRRKMAQARRRTLRRRRPPLRTPIRLAIPAFSTHSIFICAAAKSSPAGPERAALYNAALGAPFDTRMVLDLETADGLPPNHPAQAQIAASGTAAAFVCSGGVCALPVHDIAGLDTLLAR